jgi:probable O-glycosylation ligase (exosortase A-associated)
LIRSLFLVCVFMAFIGGGFAAPFVATLGYVWVDTFRPQGVAYIILNQIPVALVMGCAAFGSYLFSDRRYPPRMTLITGLTITMCIWMTATCLWAQVPDAAWSKWNWAFKTVMFSAFIPLVIRSRVQIEAFAQTFLFSLAANFIPFGLKTMISGGGYGRNLGLMSGDANLAEGGLLSTFCLMAIPLAFHLAKHTQIIPRLRIMPLGYLALAGLALATTIGTYERSALIGLVVMGAIMIMRSRRKILFALFAAVVAAGIIYQTSAGWGQRMSTMEDPTADTSALTRLLVWEWTYRFTLTHPFGGGFQSYIIDRLEYPDGAVETGRAFHSIYFEVLGEQGWPGLAMFLAIAGSTMLNLIRLSRRTRKIPELAWCADMSDALQASLAVFLTAGAFVGIACQPPFWYFIAMSVSLREYVRRVEQPPQAEGWRARALPMAAASASAGQPPPWRRPALGRTAR